MNQQTYDEVSGKLLAAAKAIEDSKRAGYTMGSVDVLANFKRVADRSGLTPGQVWTVYFLKHVDAICSMMCRPELPVSEAPEGRFCDATNYLKLGWGLLEEACAAADDAAYRDMAQLQAFSAGFCAPVAAESHWLRPQMMQDVEERMVAGNCAEVQRSQGDGYGADFRP